MKWIALAALLVTAHGSAASLEDHAALARELRQQAAVLTGAAASADDLQPALLELAKR